MDGFKLKPYEVSTDTLNTPQFDFVYEPTEDACLKLEFTPSLTFAGGFGLYKTVSARLEFVFDAPMSLEYPGSDDQCHNGIANSRCNSAVNQKLYSNHIIFKLSLNIYFVSTTNANHVTVASF